MVETNYQDLELSWPSYVKISNHYSFGISQWVHITVKYEKPQKGNPHELTINQHCLPARSIERFTNSSECVEVFLKDEEKQFPVKPSNKIFCAMRAWDQKAESGFMKDIEDRYQALADRVIQQEILILDKREELLISKMFALWNTRWHWDFYSDQTKHIELTSILSGDTLSIDQEEGLEKAGITTMRSHSDNVTIPIRLLTGIGIKANIHQAMSHLTDANWEIITCTEGEFVVPDTANVFRYLPLTPHFCFFSQSRDQKLNPKQINQELIKGAKRFYFARDLSKILL